MLLWALMLAVATSLYAMVSMVHVHAAVDGSSCGSSGPVVLLRAGSFCPDATSGEFDRSDDHDAPSLLKTNGFSVGSSIMEAQWEDGDSDDVARDFDVGQYEWFRNDVTGEALPDMEQYIVSFSTDAFVAASDLLRDIDGQDSIPSAVLSFLPETSYHMLISSMAIDAFEAKLDALIDLKLEDTMSVDSEGIDHVILTPFEDRMKVAPEAYEIPEKQRLLAVAESGGGSDFDGGLTVLHPRDVFASMNSSLLQELELHDGMFGGGNRMFIKPGIENIETDSESRIGILITVIAPSMVGGAIDESYSVDMVEIVRAVEDYLREEDEGLSFSIEAGADDVLTVFLRNSKDEDGVLRTVERLASLPFVVWIEPKLNVFINNLQTAVVLQSGKTFDTPANKPVWGAGITGKGQVVGTGDTGVDVDSCFFSERDKRQNAGYFNSVNNNHRKILSYRVLANRDDDHGHGTHTAGSIAGVAFYDDADNPDFNSGSCPSCKLVVTDLGPLSEKETGLLRTPRTSMSSYYGYAQEKGAFIHSDSWGTETTAYTRMSRDVDYYAWINQYFLPIFSAGNLGVMLSEVSTVSDPATAKNAIAVGATLSPRSQSPTGFGEAFDLTISGRSSAGENAVLEKFNRPDVYRILRGTFGPRLSSDIIRNRFGANRIVVGEPLLGCSPLTNAAEVAGNTVLLKRGDCFFVEKAQFAEEAGAALVIIYNDLDGGFFKVRSPRVSSACQRLLPSKNEKALSRIVPASIDIIIRKSAL